VQSGQKVLINGASGGVGVYAVQLAKYYGAEVTGVCSAKNLELVQSLGADQVIDYTRQDFTLNTEAYDVILDTVAGKNDFVRCKNALKPQGIYLAVAGGLREMLAKLRTSITGGKKVMAGTPSENLEDLLFIKDLIEAGRLKPMIDRRYPLAQTAEAHRYVDTGRKRGSVVITMNSEA
jgi:NADPH:quinone reductase-like Zn-dependent oxidoreductase